MNEMVHANRSGDAITSLGLYALRRPKTIRNEILFHKHTSAAVPQAQRN